MGYLKDSEEGCMHLPKRTRRRQRAKHKVLLDAIALKKICANYLWSMETWGGTRCGGCGKEVRPHWLTNLSGPLNVDESIGWITAFGYTCHKGQVKCPGKNPNWMFEIKEHQT